MSEPCERCEQGPQGESGHERLDFYVGGPFPGHRIYKCTACGERWIRHHGAIERFGWTNYAAQFAEGIRRPSTALKHGLKRDLKIAS